MTNNEKRRLGEIIPDPGKTRGLHEINRIFKTSKPIESVVANFLMKKTTVEVLEVGFGWGRALMELAWQFHGKNVVFHGVEAKPRPPIEKREDLCKIAIQFDSIPQSELPNFKLPQVYFYDASTLHFDDETMDFIYSAVTIRFIRDKIKFIEEVCRVLKPGGCAALHLGETNWNYPYSVMSDDRFLTPYTSRLVLKHRSELIPLPAFFQLFDGDVFTFQFSTESRCVIFIKKLKSGRLHLNLQINDHHTMTGRELPLRDIRGEVRSGFRTVYDVPADLYSTLFDQGLLSHDKIMTDIRIPEAWHA